MKFPDTFHWMNNLSPFPPESWEKLEGYGREKTVARGNMLISEGEVQKDLYLVMEGIQMSYLEKPDQLHVVAFTYPPGLCAIPGSFSLQKPAPYSLKALTESRLLSIPFFRLEECLETDSRLEKAFRKMTELILAGVIERHLERHSLSMEARFLSFCQRSPHLLHQVPHRYLASYLGMDATNFSKLFNRVKIDQNKAL